MALGHVAGAAGALVAPGGRSVRGLATAGALVGASAGLALGMEALLHGTPFRLEVPQLLAMAGGVSFQLDRLGGFFLVVVEMVAVPAALFGGTYSRVYDGTPALRPLGALLNLFLLALSLVPLADNVVTFVLTWELMSVASYLLVLTESDRRETREAGLWYLAMAHGGLVLLMAAFLILAGGAASTGFADLRAAAGALPPPARNAVFVLGLLGFGSKAGLVPLHVWLPLAHPAAPSHVSALMSGAMIKVGVYGLLRLALDLLGGGPPWWGGVVLAAGAVSALLGILYALTEQDLKRLLAYSSVENVGIIFLAVGAGMLFQSYGLATLAVLGLVAGLYHTLNHACFKGLLFLGSGAVLHAAHTRDMEQLGGLIRGMPRTALYMLVGAAAIAGLPPLNGFVSEWLVFQALLRGPELPRAELGLVMAFAVGMLALTSGLAAACFVKAFGISFLAMPRSPRAAEAREVPRTMQASMAFLAVACLALGVAPSLVVPVLGAAVAGLGGLPADLVTALPGVTLEMPGAVGVVAPAALAAVLVLVPVAVVLAFRWGAVDRRLRVGDTWGCGRIGQTADGIHGDRVRGAPAAGLRRAVPPDRGSLHRLSPRVAVLRPVDCLPERGRSLVRAASLRAGGVAPSPDGLPRTLAAGRIPPPLSALHDPRPRRAAADVAMDELTRAAVAAGQTLLALLLAPGLVGLIRWMKARLQNRRGAPAWQPYFELRKLLGKEVVVSRNASWLFRAAPFVIFGSTVAAAALVPVLAAPLTFDTMGDLIALVYLLVLGTFALALAGLDPGSAFGGMGASREMTVAALAEPTIGLAVFALALSAGSTNLGRIVAATLADPERALSPGHLLAFGALFIVTLAETGRLPVDNPATHLELTMIHEAMVLEYSGRYLALIEWASATKLLVLFALLGNLFVPWGVARALTAEALLVAAGSFVLKLLALAVTVAVFETRVAKLRLFRVPELLSVSFVLALLAVSSSFLLR